MGCGYALSFGQCTDIALLVSLFFLVVPSTPAYICTNKTHKQHFPTFSLSPIRFKCQFGTLTHASIHCHLTVFLRPFTPFEDPDLQVLELLFSLREGFHHATEVVLVVEMVVQEIVLVGMEHGRRTNHQQRTTKQEQGIEDRNRRIPC